jgi:dolichol kinase
LIVYHQEFRRRLNTQSLLFELLILRNIQSRRKNIQHPSYNQHERMKGIPGYMGNSVGRLRTREGVGTRILIMTCVLMSLLAFPKAIPEMCILSLAILT